MRTGMYIFIVLMYYQALYLVLDTHALVKFIDEDCPGIVPLKRLVQKENTEYNGSCGVRWSNRKVYKSFF